MEEEKSVIINSIIGHGTCYDGNLAAIDLLRIDGNFSGVAQSQDVILIGEHGKVKGTLIAPKVIIAGIFHGKIEDCRLVILQSSAVVLGGLSVQDVIVESGAMVSGSLYITASNVRTVVTHALENNVPTNVQTRTVGKFSKKMLEKLFEV